MATKSSTTKAKTKNQKSKSTTKKSTSTSAAKARASKATTKQTAKPIKSASASAKPAARRVGITMLTLRRLNLLAIALYAVLAAAAGAVMSSASYQLTVGHWTRDDLASVESTVFAPAVRSLYDLEIRWAVVGILLVSAILPLLYVTKFEKRYSEAVRTTRMVPWRWFDLGITAALMLEVVALLTGVQDMFVLKALGGLIFVTCLLGLIAERQNNTSDKPVWSAFATSIVSGILPWVVIVSYAISTVVFGSVRTPWFVYALQASMLIGFALLAINQWRQYRKVGTWQNYMMVERNYAVINILTKVAFAVILIVGLR